MKNIVLTIHDASDILMEDIQDLYDDIVDQSLCGIVRLEITEEEIDLLNVDVLKGEQWQPTE